MRTWGGWPQPGRRACNRNKRHTCTADKIQHFQARSSPADAADKQSQCAGLEHMQPLQMTSKVRKAAVGFLHLLSPQCCLDESETVHSTHKLLKICISSKKRCSCKSTKRAEAGVAVTICPAGGCSCFNVRMLKNVHLHVEVHLGCLHADTTERAVHSVQVKVANHYIKPRVCDGEGILCWVLNACALVHAQAAGFPEEEVCSNTEMGCEQV